MHDAVEGKGRAQRRGPEPRDQAIEPIRSREPPETVLEQQHGSDVGQRVEEQVKDVCCRRGGRGLATQRLKRQEEVAEGPGHQAATKNERHRAAGPVLQAFKDTDRRRDEL